MINAPLNAEKLGIFKKGSGFHYRRKQFRFFQNGTFNYFYAPAFGAGSVDFLDAPFVSIVFFTRFNLNGTISAVFANELSFAQSGEFFLQQTNVLLKLIKSFWQRTDASPFLPFIKQIQNAIEGYHVSINLSCGSPLQNQYGRNCSLYSGTNREIGCTSDITSRCFANQGRCKSNFNKFMSTHPSSNRQKIKSFWPIYPGYRSRRLVVLSDIKLSPVCCFLSGGDTRGECCEHRSAPFPITEFGDAVTERISSFRCVQSDSHTQEEKRQGVDMGQPSKNLTIVEPCHPSDVSQTCEASLQLIGRVSLPKARPVFFPYEVIYAQ